MTRAVVWFAVVVAIAASAAADTGEECSGLFKLDNRDFGAGTPEATSFKAEPASLRADGTSVATLTLRLMDASGSPVAGKQIQFRSDRGSDDVIVQPSGPTGADGTAVGSVKSSKAGTACIRARNVTDSRDLPVTAQVTFYSSSARPVIKTLKVDPLPIIAPRIGSGSLNYVFRAEVDWNGTPGKVRFIINDDLSHSVDVPGTPQGAELAVDMEKINKVAEPGSFALNTVTAVAYDADLRFSMPAVQPFTYIVLPAWLTSEGVTKGPFNVSFDPLTGQLKILANVTLLDKTKVDASTAVPDTLPEIGGKWGLKLNPVHVTGKLVLEPGPSKQEPVVGSFDVQAKWAPGLRSTAAGNTAETSMPQSRVQAQCFRDWL